MTHWQLTSDLVACGCHDSFIPCTPDIKFVTCPKCRGEWEKLVSRLTLEVIPCPPVKGRRK